MRRKFDEQGNFVDQHGDYPSMVKEVGKLLNVSVLDLHASSKEVIVQHGAEDSKHLFLNLEKGVWNNFPEGKEDNTNWTLTPQAKPDIYTLAKSPRAKWVKFYTDIDSIKIQMQLIENGNYKEGSIPELWDGRATERIATVLNQLLIE